MCCPRKGHRKMTYRATQNFVVGLRDGKRLVRAGELVDDKSPLLADGRKNSVLFERIESAKVTGRKVAK